MLYEMTVFHRRDYILLLNDKLIILTIKSKAEVIPLVSLSWFLGTVSKQNKVLWTNLVQMFYFYW